MSRTLMKVWCGALRAGDRMLYEEPDFTEDGDPIYDAGRTSEVLSVERDGRKTTVRFRSSSLMIPGYSEEWIERDVQPGEEDEDDG